jgi:hypothetical protein
MGEGAGEIMGEAWSERGGEEGLMERERDQRSQPSSLLRRSTALAMDDVVLDLLKRDCRAVCHHFSRLYILC